MNRPATVCSTVLCLMLALLLPNCGRHPQQMPGPADVQTMVVEYAGTYQPGPLPDDAGKATPATQPARVILTLAPDRTFEMNGASPQECGKYWVGNGHAKITGTWLPCDDGEGTWQLVLSATSGDDVPFAARIAAHPIKMPAISLTIADPQGVQVFFYPVEAAIRTPSSAVTPAP